MSLFGSSGIRGVTFKEITPELAMAIGASVGSDYKRVVVGRDTRTTGKMLEQGIVAGLTSAGASAYTAGIVSTPTLAYASRDYDCGLMITASHNPPEYNGVKMWNSDGSAFDEHQTDEVERRILNERYDQVSWMKIGSCHTHYGAVEDHMQSVLDKIGGSDLKVVVDCGCGATFNITPALLRAMGNDVYTLNTQPDGYFPGRLPEPVEEHLSDLKQMVRFKEADLGIAHDGDGDRMVAVDGKGNIVSGDRLLALFASQFKGDIATSIDASMIVESVAGGTVHRTRVGDVFVSQLMKEKGLVFGGEPSGTFIFSSHGYFPDGVYAAALLCKLVEERPLEELLKSIPSYPSFRASFSFDPDMKEKLMSRLEEEMRSMDCVRLLTIDGYRAEFDDGWFLIRVSGTEPKIRVTAEARSDEVLNEFRERAEYVIRRCLE